MWRWFFDRAEATLTSTGQALESFNITLAVMAAVIVFFAFRTRS